MQTDCIDKGGVGVTLDKIRFINAKGAMLDFWYLTINRIPLNINVPIENLTDGDGGVKTGLETVDPKQIRVTGPIYDPDKKEIDNKKDELFNLLQYTPIQIYRRNKYISGHPRGIPERWIDENELRLEVSFICPDPFWYQSAEEEFNPTEIEIEGNYETYPEIRLDINETTTGSIQIDNTTTNQTFYINEIAVENEDTIIINNEDFVVEHNEENILSKVNNEWLLNGFSLVKGTNELSYSGINADLTYKYRNKWL